MSQLKTYYDNEVVSKLTETFQYENIMEVPKVSKIVLNIGMGEAIQNIKLLDAAVEELKAISGQQPVITRAKKSIAAFKLRAGMPIGCMVTLRRKQMWDFLYKLVNIALARVRDFRGLPTGPLTAAGTTPWASRNRSCSLRSTTIRFMRSTGWISPW